MKYRGEYLAFKVLLGLFASRSREGRLKWGRSLGRLWYAVDRKHRRMAMENISLGLGVSRAQAESIARRNFENLGCTLAEFAAFGKFEEIRKTVTIEGLEHLRAALSLGKGMFFLSGHCGNWELGAALLAGETSLTAVVRPMKNPLTDRLINDRRFMGGLRVMGHRNSTRAILKKIGAGESVGILLDQNTSHREAVFVSFLGPPASVNQGLALLAAKTGAPVVPAFIHREEGYAQRMVIGPPIELVRDDDRRREIGMNTARFTAVLETYVRRYPEQWFWVHNRWKNQPLPGDEVYRP